MTERHTSYLVDLSSVQLDETNASWIQAFPLGTWEHPVYGTIESTPERVQRYADNVKANVRGQELDIDYDHKEKSGEAAGWVKDAKADPQNGLMLLVEWTKDAATKIKNKSYRYFSPDYVDEWTSPVNKKTFKDVLFGGALTNRPFLKGIMPVNLSEVDVSVPSQSEPDKGGTTVTPEQVKKAATKLGLGEDATEEQVFTALDQLEIEFEPEGAPEPTLVDAQLSEQIRRLAEGNPLVQQLVANQEAMSRQLGEATTALHLAEVDRQINTLADYARSKNFALAPATQDELRKALVPLQGHKQLSENVVNAYKGSIDIQIKQLGEKGHAGREEEREDSATAKFATEVKKLTEPSNGQKGMSYADAVSQVTLHDPDLYDQYRKESYADREGDR